MERKRFWHPALWWDCGAILLTYLGNPANMGFCIACFIRDIAGQPGTAPCRGCAIHPPGDHRHCLRRLYDGPCKGRLLSPRRLFSCSAFCTGVRCDGGRAGVLRLPFANGAASGRRRRQRAGGACWLCGRYPGRCGIFEKGLFSRAQLPPKQGRGTGPSDCQRSAFGPAARHSFLSLFQCGGSWALFMPPFSSL